MDMSVQSFYKLCIVELAIGGPEWHHDALPFQLFGRGGNPDDTGMGLVE